MLSEIPAASIFSSEDRNSRFVSNTGTYQQLHTTISHKTTILTFTTVKTSNPSM